MTRVHAADGSLLAEYARERRLYLPSAAIPPLVKEAFISAEDKNFYTHRGVDPEGIVRAALVFARRPPSTSRAPRPSPSRSPRTSCLSNERTLERKIREILLAFRIEAAYSKDKILELYLNEIYLGLGNYGVAAAALELFRQIGARADHRRGRLSRRAAEGAERRSIRSATASAPSTRRNYVIDRMVENGYVTARGRRRRPAPSRSASHPRVLSPDSICRRLFRRGGAARTARPLRREEALRGRAVGPHHARSARCS